MVDTFGAAIGGDRDSSVKLLTRVSFLSSLDVSIEVKETSKPGFTNVTNFYSQTRSSVPVANELMNSFTEK